jgi:AcrR family transcriptional regulator
MKDMAVEAQTTSVRRTPARRGSGETLRTEIIEAASALLAESGDVETMSLRAVARRVGIATTSIYLHFADIDALILAVKLRRFAELEALLGAARAKAGAAPIDRVRAVGHAYVAYGLDHPGNYRVMFSASSRGMLVGPSGLMVGLDTFQALAAEVAAALGVTSDHPDTQLVATNIWAFVHGVVALRTSRPHFPWPEVGRMIDDMVDRVFRLPSSSSASEARSASASAAKSAGKAATK